MRGGRMGDVLAFFDWEHSANGPTEAINGRLETLWGIAMGFRIQAVSAELMY